jgi:hypothetical protein
LLKLPQSKHRGWGVFEALPYVFGLAAGWKLGTKRRRAILAVFVAALFGIVVAAVNHELARPGLVLLDMLGGAVAAVVGVVLRVSRFVGRRLPSRAAVDEQRATR